MKHIGAVRVFAAFCLLLTVAHWASGMNPNIRNLFEIKMIHVIFTHGERTRNNFSETYPNDPYNTETFSPYGFGALTDTGKATMYDLGGRLRSRYGYLVNDSLQPRHVQCWSGDVERLKLSASIVLAGLLPPDRKETWNKDINWQPASVNYLPWPLDKYFFGYYCPRYRKELARVTASSTRWESITGEGFRPLVNEIGKDIRTPEDLYRLHQNYLGLINYNKTPPPMLNHRKKLLEDASELKLKLASATRLLRQLNGGEMLKKIIRDVERFIRGGGGPLITLYSGHEATVAALLRCMDVTNPPGLIGYGSALIFDLHRNKISQDYYLTATISGPNTDERELYTSNLPLMMNWKLFRRNVRFNVAENFTAACGRVTPVPMKYEIPYD